MKRTLLLVLGLAALICLPTSAQDIKFYGIGHNKRVDDNTDHFYTKYIGWNADLQKSIFTYEINGISTMTWDGFELTAPKKDPAVRVADFYSNGKFTNNEKALWANNFNLMYGNSGAVYVDGLLVTVMSRDEQSTVDDELFNVRLWDAKTGDMLATSTFPKNMFLESAGMSYNPKDGKVYGLFYISESALPKEITEDPEYFTDEDDKDFDREGQDAGYAICTIDLNTFKVTPITKGLYYQNFVTFAINSEGRAFALTSGGANGYLDDNGRMRDINNELTGAQLCEFNLETGNMMMVPYEATDGDSTYTDYKYPVGATGFSSQYKRQSACFSKSNPNIMYWNGYYNSGKGIGAGGSWTTLPDSEDGGRTKSWITNHKYDTCLYQVNITTGEATRLSTIEDRWTFSAMWVDGDDPSDGSGFVALGIDNAKAQQNGGSKMLYNLQGQQVKSKGHGLYIIKDGAKTNKVMM
ncbi:MAG: hypothetical protein K6F89_00240 [Prevotella sp.]|nr:hypothetical protein [Prevotella sp.]